MSVYTLNLEKFSSILKLNRHIHGFTYIHHFELLDFSDDCCVWLSSLGSFIHFLGEKLENNDFFVSLKIQKVDFWIDHPCHKFL